MAVKGNFLTHPNGRIGTVTCDATAILEQEEEETGGRDLYWVGGRLYKQYGLLGGEACKRPMDPERSQGKDLCLLAGQRYRRASGISGEVTENKTYVAVFSRRLKFREDDMKRKTGGHLGAVAG